MTYAYDQQELPEHVRQIIERDGEIQFTPPSFERWVGRLQMLRTVSSMFAFLAVWIAAYETGLGWETATIRGIIAAIVFHFFAWAVGLFLFGELYDAEVKRARVERDEKERERARRIEQYYRERLRAQSEENDEQPASAGPPGYVPTDQQPTQPLQQTPSWQSEPQRYAA